MISVNILKQTISNENILATFLLSSFTFKLKDEEKLIFYLLDEVMGELSDKYSIDDE